MDQNKIKFKIDRKLTREETAAFSIVKTLKSNGFESYIAGGAVRDELLGLPAHDIDIATSAKPEEIKKIFPDATERGKAFGVLAVNCEDRDFEIATFRKDLGISDHRRPQNIEFTNAKEDALRRDFTINGLFYDPKNQEIIDFVEGLKDLKNHQIRFIGEAKQRIEEDYLRMLRAVRFSSRLNFRIEKESLTAIINNAVKIKEISAERIRDELSKILVSKNRKNGIEILSQLKILSEILPELEQTKKISQPKEFHSEGDVWTHILLALNNINHIIEDPTEELVWAVLLHDIAKPETLGFRSVVGKTSITFFDHDVKSAEKTKEILDRLRFSHHFIDKITWAIRQHMRIVNAFRGMSERKQQKLFCDPNIQLLLDLTFADLSASLRQNGKPDLKMYEEAVNLKEKFEKEASLEEKKQVKKFDLITGYDIIQNLKISAGPEVGKIKAEIEKAFLDEKINTRTDALKMLEGYRK